MDNTEFLNKSMQRSIAEDGKRLSKLMDEHNKRKFEIEDLCIESYESIIEINKLTKKNIKSNKRSNLVNIILTSIGLIVGISVLILTYLMYINLK